MNALSQFTQSINWTDLGDMVLRVVAILLCLIIHEVSHGLAAYKLGDPTAKMNHRLSLNPLRHLDLFGTLMMVVVGFGWAKPVPVDPRYFKKPKQGMALTALAGPVSNFVLAFISALAVNGLMGAVTVKGEGTALFTAARFFYLLVLLNIGLGSSTSFPSRPWTAPRCWLCSCRTGLTSAGCNWSAMGCSSSWPSCGRGSLTNSSTLPGAR